MVNSQYFDVRYWVSSHRELTRLIDEGDGQGRRRHPARLRPAAARASPPTIQVIVDASDPLVATSAVNAAASLGAQRSLQMITRTLEGTPLGAPGGAAARRARARLVQPRPRLRHLHRAGADRRAAHADDDHRDGGLGGARAREGHARGADREPDPALGAAPRQDRPEPARGLRPDDHGPPGRPLRLRRADPRQPAAPLRALARLHAGHARHRHLRSRRSPARCRRPCSSPS